MTDQLALSFDTPRGAVSRRRHSDPDTCIGGKIRKSALLLAVLAELEARGPGTDWELLERLGLRERAKPSLAKRRHDLGCVDTGDRRPSPDGRDCIVWRLP